MVCDDLTMNAMNDLSTKENFSFLCNSIFFAVYRDLQHDYDVREPYTPLLHALWKQILKLAQHLSKMVIKLYFSQHYSLYFILVFSYLWSFWVWVLRLWFLVDEDWGLSGRGASGVEGPYKYIEE